MSTNNGALSQRKTYYDFNGYLKLRQNDKCYNKALLLRESNPTLAVTLLQTVLENNPHDQDAKLLLQQLSASNDDCS